MCTSERLRQDRTQHRARARGFSVIELILGLALTVCLAVAVAPLWLSLQSTGVREGDQTVRLLQARVAVARFEHDLRLASARRLPVLAERTDLGGLAVLRWCFWSGRRPMPRRSWWNGRSSTGPSCAVAARVRRQDPSVFSHSLFVDHKTMLEGVKPGSALAYLVGGVVVDPSAGVVDLASIDGVVLELQTAAEGANAPVHVTARGRVGR